MNLRARAAWIVAALAFAAAAVAQPTLRPGWPVDHGQAGQASLVQPNPVALVQLADSSRRIVTQTATAARVYDLDGNMTASWNAAGQVPGPADAGYMCAGPNLGDVDGDGTVEVVLGFRGLTGRDRGIVAFEMDGTPVAGSAVSYADLASVNISAFALADLDGDDDMEIVYTADSLYAMHGDGTPVAGFPWGLGGESHWIASPVVYPGSATDTAAVVWLTQDNQIHARRLGETSEMGGWPVSFSATDDGYLGGPVLMPTANGWIVAVASPAGAYAFFDSSVPVAGFPVTLQNVTDVQMNNLCVGDVDGNGSPELLFKPSNQYLHAIALTGAYMPGFPMDMGTNNGFRETVSSILPADGQPAMMFTGSMTESVGTTHFIGLQGGAYLPGFPVTLNTNEDIPRLFTALFAPEEDTLHIVVHTVQGFTAVYDLVSTWTDPMIEWASPSGQASGNALYPDTVEIVEPALPALAFSPMELNFEEVIVGESDTTWLTIENTGTGAGLITDAVFTPTIAAEMALTEEVPLEIAAGGSMDLGVVWTPPDDSGLLGTLTLHHNDIQTGSPVTIILSGTLSDVADGPQAQPDRWFLAPATPNPFNPVTTLRFGLKHRSHATLVVVDLTGREVARIVDGERAAGEYRVQFDASRLPSGLYFARLVADEYRAVQKLVLVR